MVKSRLSIIGLVLLAIPGVAQSHPRGHAHVHEPSGWAAGVVIAIGLTLLAAVAVKRRG